MAKTGLFPLVIVPVSSQDPYRVPEFPHVANLTISSGFNLKEHLQNNCSLNCFFKFVNVTSAPKLHYTVCLYKGCQSSPSFSRRIASSHL